MDHKPVLLHEVLEALDPQPGDVIIDGTMDGGGHAAAIMEKIAPNGRFLGVDLEETMIAKGQEQMANGKWPKLADAKFIHGNYADLPEILKKEKSGKADGLLLDLGFSSEQLEQSGRGFSFGADHADEPLLMTYDDSRTPVRELLRSLKEEELANIIFEFGGERFSRRIAKAIVERKWKKPITTAGEFAEVVRTALPHGYERGRIDPATRTFQAFRIYANGELENLKTILGRLGDVVKIGGCVTIVSFHSLEDRIVKNAFRELTKEGKAEALYKKPVTAGEEELRENSRSRSAKLRAITIKIKD